MVAAMENYLSWGFWGFLVVISFYIDIYTKIFLSIISKYTPKTPKTPKINYKYIKKIKNDRK